MTGNDVVTRARLILKDANGVRWDDDEMLLWIIDGQREIVRKRPDSRYASSVVVADLNDPTALGDTLDIDDTFIGAMADWVLYRCFSKDAEFSPNKSQSKEHFANFTREIS